MQAKSPSAFFLSLLLHGLVVAVIFFTAFALREPARPVPKIFELVAGPGDNYAATAAPAGSESGSVQLAVPPTPALARPAPVIPTAPPEPVVRPVPPEPPKPVETKAPDFTREMKRAAGRKEQRIIAEDKRRRAAEEKERAVEEKREREAEARRKKTEADAAKQMSFADFKKLNGAPKAAAAAPRGDIKVKSIDVKGVVGGTGHAPGAGGRALTRAEGNLWDAYYALLKQRLKAALNKPGGLSDLLEVTIQFDVAGSGALSGVRLVRSSGNREFDQAALDAFASVRSIGTTPTGKGDTGRVTIKMREDE